MQFLFQTCLVTALVHYSLAAQADATTTTTALVGHIPLVLVAGANYDRNFLVSIVGETSKTTILSITCASASDRTATAAAREEDDCPFPPRATITSAPDAVNFLFRTGDGYQVSDRYQIQGSNILAVTEVASPGPDSESEERQDVIANLPASDQTYAAYTITAGAEKLETPAPVSTTGAMGPSATSSSGSAVEEGDGTTPDSAGAVGVSVPMGSLGGFVSLVIAGVFGMGAFLL